MNKLIPLLFLVLLVSCGKEVTFDKATQESYSQVTQAAPQMVEKQGTFTKKSTLNDSTVSSGGASYGVSEYSSHQALQFYSKASLNSSVPVKFRGEVKNNKIFLETITPL